MSLAAIAAAAAKKPLTEFQLNVQKAMTEWNKDSADHSQKRDISLSISIPADGALAAAFVRDFPGLTEKGPLLHITLLTAFVDGDPQGFIEKILAAKLKVTTQFQFTCTGFHNPLPWIVTSNVHFAQETGQRLPQFVK
eukprot:TRINITY_DN4107_c0_g1_i1.p1 TRINITY_DN4107_c0_g1~~TRINITY_DN4107_c0_g1_i1.p1  ORF type:complete len:138 (-),score=7.59 TRINITY_DN4107_c0_g1_i1:32-445(-)